MVGRGLKTTGFGLRVDQMLGSGLPPKPLHKSVGRSIKIQWGAFLSALSRRNHKSRLVQSNGKPCAENGGSRCFAWPKSRTPTVPASSPARTTWRGRKSPSFDSGEDSWKLGCKMFLSNKTMAGYDSG